MVVEISSRIKLAIGKQRRLFLSHSRHQTPLNGCLINHLQFENNTITRLAGLTSTRSHHPVETVAGVAKQDAGTLITTSATTAVSSLQYSMKSSKIRRQLYRENLCSMM